MIPFTKSLIRFEYIKLKSVSVALGGSLRVYNEEKSVAADKEITERYEVPFAVARQYQKLNKPASYLVPIDACIVWFGDQIVYVESRTRNDVFDKTTLPSGREWISRSEMNYDRFLKNIDGQWFTDGSYVYQLPTDFAHYIEHAEYLTSDGKFRGVSVQSYKFADLEFSQLMENASTRSCVACIDSNGGVILTPPIWKNILDIRKENGGDDNPENKRFRFDLINEKFAVNLEFGLNAGRTIGEVFGYDHIGPLQLDELMIRLCNVNLPNVPKSIRATFNIGMPFMQAFAWVVGLTGKCTTMSDFTKMRSLLKQLCTKGIFTSRSITDVYRTEETAQMGAPKMIDPKDALANITSKTDMDLRAFWMQGKTDEAKVDRSVLNAIGAMLD